jgi:hypothetical protein
MPEANVRRRDVGSPEPSTAATTHAAQVPRETGKMGDLGNEGGFT